MVRGCYNVDQYEYKEHFQNWSKYSKVILAGQVLFSYRRRPAGLIRPFPLPPSADSSLYDTIETQRLLGRWNGPHGVLAAVKNLWS